MKTKTSKQKDRSKKKHKKLTALANLMFNHGDDPKNSSTLLNTKSGRAKERNEIKEYNMNDDKSEAENEPKMKKPKFSSETVTGNKAANYKPIDKLEGVPLQITEEQYLELKRSLRDRKRKLQSCAVFHLRESGQRALLEVPQDRRTPIFLTDVQHLLMSSLIGKHSPCRPERWCFIEKPLKLSHTIVLIINGLSLYHYQSNESVFKETNEIFKTKLEIVLPPCQEGSILQELATVPLTNVQEKELIDKHGSLETAMEMNKDPTLLVKTIFPVEETRTIELPEAENKIPSTDKIPRTKLLLSALQMVDEGYPMPLRGELQARFKNYIFTKEKYNPVTDSSPMYAVDCEMCRTALGYNELTRISIVNEKLETVYETLVMPTNKIVDYLTQYSGITPELMNAVTKKLPEVQRELQNLLPPDAILVGQSLNADLNALKMMHPYIIDTSVIFNLTGARRRKSKLKTLAITFLDEFIQGNVDGHDPVEDSLASMKLVQKKLQHDLDYGDIILLEKKRFNEVRAKTRDNITNNLFAHVAHKDKHTAIVTTGNLHEDVKIALNTATAVTDKDCDKNSLKTIKYFEFEKNKQTIKKTREIALEHALTIANITVSPDQLRLDTVEKTMSKIDKWIGKFWKTLAHSGMFLTLMGGSVECPSGVVKVAIKKNIADVPAEVPENA